MNKYFFCLVTLIYVLTRILGTWQFKVIEKIGFIEDMSPLQFIATQLLQLHVHVYWYMHTNNLRFDTINLLFTTF